MSINRPLRIGITCYPSVGGSGILASALGEDLARRGHEVHFISSDRPFRLPENTPRVHFHPVAVGGYQLFKYPDYTLPLSVKMAEVSLEYELDVLHVHYAVPHATAALLANAMLSANQRPAVITTLHGTDTTLLGRNPAYRPAIRHALLHSDAVTAVSRFLQQETQQVLQIDREIHVIHNFFVPRMPGRSQKEVRDELQLGNKTMLLHSSNLRPLKRIDLLLDAVSRIRPRESFKLVILAGEDFSPYLEEVRRLKLEECVIVRNKVKDIEDYLQVADIGIVTSESESFCLSILEAMHFACPSVSTRVGGIPEVIDDRITGRLVTFGDANALAKAIEELIGDPDCRAAMGKAAQQRARLCFSAEEIVPQYESLYRSLAIRRR